MADKANQIFLPWVQPNLAAGGSALSVDTLSPNDPASLSPKLRIFVNTVDVPKDAYLCGPGDVIGIDSQQVIRTDPPHRATDFEPNYFPAIEFDRPDFPWLFTPRKANDQGHLRPWLCLIVVRRQKGIELRAGQPLPVLKIDFPAQPLDELPDLAESHLWAHAQVTGLPKNELETKLDSVPTRTLSRLLCPRRLTPSTDYLACVVPTFEVGRQAGLNKIPDTDKLKPAWISRITNPAAALRDIEIPVYYSWAFRTGVAGDFEELVRRIQPRPLPIEVGKRFMDLSDPGFEIPPTPNPSEEGKQLGLESALRRYESEADAWIGAYPVAFQRALAQIINTPSQVASNAGDNQTPVLAPPIYGCWHAASNKVAMPGTPNQPGIPPWLNELNLDPRHRVAAAIGTRVIQDDQEELMSSAWQQLGQIQKINQRFRQAQLSRAVNEKYLAKTFTPLPEETFIQFLGPAMSRLEGAFDNAGAFNTVAASPRLMLQALSDSFVPATVVSTPLRRITRRRGPINRRNARRDRAAVGSMVAIFNTAHAPLDLVPKRGKLTIADVSQLRPQLAEFQLERISPENLGPAPVAAPDLAFWNAAKSHQTYLTEAFTTAPNNERLRLSTVGFKSSALDSLDPAKTVARAVLAGFNLENRSSQTGDDLEPIMDAPFFTRPMYEALRDVSQDLLLAGLEHVPQDSVNLLKTNQKFIESFLIGLNVEMGRELLWRNYLTDQRGTYFQRFWSIAGTDRIDPDIPSIHQWQNRQLGVTEVLGSDKLVLLIRGELLKRYPGAVIYAVKAIVRDEKRQLATDYPDPAQGKVEQYPIFRGSLEPDVTFLGFDLTATQPTEGDGWFFVLQQQPTAPRFGLDDAPFKPGESQTDPLTTWNNLNWRHVGTEDPLNKLTHIIVGDVQLPQPAPTPGTWGRNSAHMAYITRQLPVRVAIHATELIS